MAEHAAPPFRGALRVARPYVRPQRVRLAVAAGAGVLEIGCQLLAPWPLALAVDHALGHRPLTGPDAVLRGLTPTALLVSAGAALLAVTLLGGLLDLCTTVASQGAAERIGGAMREAVFRHVLTLSLRWHDRMRTGEIVSRLTTDVGRVLDAVVLTVTSLVPDVVLLGGTTMLLFLVDPVLAWLGLAVVPVLALLGAYRRRQVRSAEVVAREAGGRLSGVATELLRNVRAVQAFGRRDRAVRLFGEPNEQVVDAEVRAVTISARWAPALDLVLAAGSGVVLVAGGLQVLGGRLSIGELLVVLSYLGGLQSPVRGLVRVAGVRAKATASALRLGELLSCTERVPEPDRPRRVRPLTRDLRLDKVSFSYEARRPVLREFDLVVTAGETVCLFGHSGAGKSTVLHLLLRLYDPDAGRILLDGVDIRELSTQELRRLVAFVPQDPWLLDGTVAENIAFGNMDATRAEVLAAGRAAWVDEFADWLPERYDTPLGESGVMLSGGQRRRVALARAVVSRASVVLLDEPTTSLDTDAARQVMGAIRSATRDRTVLLVTHDPLLAAVADRTVHVGRAAETAPLAPLPAPERGSELREEVTHHGQFE
ncbi:MAG: transporter related [Frankiales bacterium]|nr:transporter related [Frankiales bacterium]